MSESSDPENPTLFLRKEQQERNSLDDTWDDTQLIKEYDKAVKRVKRQAIQKIQAELGLLNEEIQEVFSDVSINKKKKKSKKNKKNPEKPDWLVGMHCRAIYSQDGQEYEAQIVRMIDAHWCVVKFIGYENEEEVKLNELTPSLGKNMRDIQIEYAKEYNKTLQDTMETEEEDKSRPNVGPAENLWNKMYSPHNDFWKKLFTPQIPSSDPPPLSKHSKHFVPWQRPPMLPTNFSSVPNFCPPPPPPSSEKFANSSAYQNPQHGFAPAPPPISTGNQAFDSMLLSWYMCGYYTGYYQRELHNG